MTHELPQPFARHYESLLKRLKLRGMRSKTIEAYSHGVRRAALHFDYRIDDLNKDQLTDYFAQILEQLSWSTLKHDLYGLKFYYAYQNSETRKMETRTLSGVKFLRKILLHILPRGFRRARNFGFLHPNSKLVKLVQLIKRVVVPPPKPRPVVSCTCCGKPMSIVRTRVKCAGDIARSLAQIRETAM